MQSQVQFCCSDSSALQNDTCFFWSCVLQVEESAKKSVESASHGSAILKLYNKWHEKLAEEEMGEEGGSGRVASNQANKEKKGLLSKVKATIHSGRKASA